MPPSDPERTLADVTLLVHDLRQPLSTLRLLTASARDLATDEATVRVIEHIASQVDDAIDVARRISRLIE
jgi:hypothetical protein